MEFITIGSVSINLAAVVSVTYLGEGKKVTFRMSNGKKVALSPEEISTEQRSIMNSHGISLLS